MSDKIRHYFIIENDDNVFTFDYFLPYRLVKYDQVDLESLIIDSDNVSFHDEDDLPDWINPQLDDFEIIKVVICSDWIMCYLKKINETTN